MPTITVEVSPDQLLRAVGQLPGDDLGAFVAQVLSLHALRVAPHLRQNEADLLLTIGRRLPADLQRHYDDLLARRLLAPLAPDEDTLLLRLTEYRELLSAERVAALASLARLRHTTVPALMAELGIGPEQ